MNLVLQFLLDYFNTGAGYSALCTARSAISTIATIAGAPAGQHPLVKRFMRAVFNKRPALPRYNTTWDPDVLLSFIKNLGANRRLSTLQLSKKLTVLLLLLSGQRCQTVHLLDLNDMIKSNSKVSFSIRSLTKTTRPGHHQPDLYFTAYAPDRRLCVLTTINAYLDRTATVRGDHTRLLLTTRDPIRPASRATISRWTKSMMADAGIDMKIFGAHSTRSAATSRAAAHLPLQTVIKTVGWSSHSVFAKYYKKPFTKQTAFNDVLLQNHS